MSILWKHSVGNTDYQVRRAGNSIRLYTNGVFHSQYNPGRPVTGSVWDLLWIPAFFASPGEIRRVLVLGVGGGAAIQQLRNFVRPRSITGIELSSIHLSIARRFFGVSGSDVELVCADAVNWMHNYKGPGFDLIIDDLFADDDGEPARAVRVTREWASVLKANLTSRGILVINFATPAELYASAAYSSVKIRHGFKSAFGLATPQNHNAVGVFLKQPASSSSLRSRLCDIPALNPRRKSAPLRYSIRRLKKIHS